MSKLDANVSKSEMIDVVENDDFRKENHYSSEEREAVRQKAISDGFVSPLVVWKDRNDLVYGYEEFAIAKEHDLPYEVQEIEFESVADCLAWIGEKRLAMPSLNAFQKTEIGLKFWEYWKSKNEAKYGKESPLKKAAVERCGRTDKSAIVGIKAGLSHNTVNKVCHILASENKKLIESCRKGEISISAAYDSINGGKDDDGLAPKGKKAKKNQTPKHKEVASLAKYCSEGFSGTEEKLDEHGLKFFILRWNEEHPKKRIDNKDVKKAIKAFEAKKK